MATLDRPARIVDNRTMMPIAIHRIVENSLDEASVFPWRRAVIGSRDVDGQSGSRRMV